MKFVCEGLPQYALVLVPPSSPDYDPLLGNIRRRLNEHTDGYRPIPQEFRPEILDEDRPTSAILLNRSPKPIAAMQVVWRFETVAGRSYRHCYVMPSAQNLLLPFGRSGESWLKMARYWHTILPGSKRYLSESGIVGDNTDVRLPTADEQWQGGYGMNMASTGGGPEPVKQITLVLDGVFFVDGEFVGPNHEKFFEQTVADAEAHMMVAKIVQQAHNNGLTPEEIFGEIEKATGPGHHPRPLSFYKPDATPEEVRQNTLRRIAFQLAIGPGLPHLANDERMIYMILEWAKAALPQFRKR